MDYSFGTSGVCPKKIDISVDGDIIRDVKFYGGCNGNLKAIGKLVAGEPIDKIAGILEGNTCGMRNTSCADQLAKALRIIQSKQAS